MISNECLYNIVFVNNLSPYLKNSGSATDGDNPSTHPDFDPDLWMEVGSSGGPDKNRVYGLSNTTVENLRVTGSVLTVGSSPSVSSTQSEEFMALKQQYKRLLTDYDQLPQMVMDIRSKDG